MRFAAVAMVSASLLFGQAAPAPTLKSIQKIYIEKMPNNLDQYIQAEIAKQLKGRLTVVLKLEDADAIMTGISEHKSGTGAAVTGRMLGLHDTATGVATIVDKTRENILWTSEAGDRSLFWGVWTRGGPRKVASRLVKSLKKALRQ